MPVVNFDTLEFAKELETQLATKADIAKIDKEIVLVKWVVFAVFVIVAIPLVKSFFA